jgi:hypothetical protein
MVRIMNAGVFICNSRQDNVVDAQHTYLKLKPVPLYFMTNAA